MNEMVLRISSNQDKKYAKRVAGAMGWRLREDGVLSARAVGAEAVNSTVKAIAICNHIEVADSYVVAVWVFRSLFFRHRRGDAIEHSCLNAEQDGSCNAVALRCYHAIGHDFC